MAKGKRATALFEVMSKARMPGRGLTPEGRPEDAGAPPEPSPSILSPRWWFKSRQRPVTDVRTFAPGDAEVVADPPAMEPPRIEPARPLDPVPQHLEPRPAELSYEPISRAQPVQLNLDRNQRQINLRLSYTSAMIGGLGFVIVVGLAVLIGKALSRGPQTAIANASSQQLRGGAVTPGVMNVTRRTEGAAPIDTTAGSERRTAAAGGGATPPGTRAAQGSFNEVRPPTTFFTDDPHRINGLNYAIIQSYPDKETAGKAVDFLTKHGIPCTVEQNLPAWRLPWPNGCVVVGTRGFTKVQNNPTLDTYKKSILDLGVQFAGSRSRFNAFEPTMYRWNKSN